MRVLLPSQRLEIKRAHSSPYPVTVAIERSDAADGEKVHETSHQEAVIPIVTTLYRAITTKRQVGSRFSRKVSKPVDVYLVGFL